MSEFSDPFDDSLGQYLDFDPEETFERRTSPRQQLTPRLKGRRSLPKTPSSSGSEKIYSARRLLVSAHQQALTDIVYKPLSSIQAKTAERRLYVSLLTPGQSRTVFKHHFGTTEDDNLVAATRFNESVKQYVKSAVHLRPTISVQLGEVGIFGTTDPAEKGKRFVGIELVGEGADHIVREHDELLAALGSSAAYFRPLKPHFSLGMTESPHVAQAMVDRLNNASVVDMARDRLKIPDASAACVTIGRSVLNLYSIHPA